MRNECGMAGGPASTANLDAAALPGCADARPHAGTCVCVDCAVRVCVAAHEREPERLGQAVQERQAVAECHRMNREAVLVDETMLRERVGERRAPESGDVVSRLLLQRRDLGLDRVRRNTSVAPLDLGQAARTQPSAAFIKFAIGLSETGHARTMS